MRGMDALYKGLNADNEEFFQDLWCARYLEMFLYLKGKKPDGDTLEEMAEIWLAFADRGTKRSDLDKAAEVALDDLLTEPNAVTHYAYETEALRKRDRATEAVNAVPARSDKNYELQKAMRYWSQQTGFYIDIIADEAALQAMKDAGVKKVRWITQHDEKVCNECDPLDQKVFDIDHVPEKPHPRCRCWLEPVMT